MNYDAVCTALAQQRNAALDEIARMAGMIADLQAKLAELEHVPPAKPIEPDPAEPTSAYVNQG